MEVVEVLVKHLLAEIVVQKGQMDLTMMVEEVL